MQLASLLLLAQIAVPPPRGYVNDFAAVLDQASVAHMTAVLTELRAKTRGEIAVVTLADIGGRSASGVALQIGRQWGVGARGAAGDPAKNLGVVVLLVPRKNHRPGTGDVFVSTGRGAEGFLPDARVGRVRDAMIPYLAQERYGEGLAVGVALVAQAFAQEFGVALDSLRAPVTLPPPEPAPSRPPVPLLLLVLLLVVLLSRGRIFLWPFLFSGLGRSRGGWGGGGFGGGGWGGGGGGGVGGVGGFGGFGGGGGFSGGGAGGKF